MTSSQDNGLPSTDTATAPVIGSIDSGNVKRVCFVLSELRGGGAEKVVVHLSATLRKMGLTVEIICLQNRGILADEAEAAGVRVVALNSLRSYDFGAMVALARELRRFRPDVINVHDRASLPYVVSARCVGGRAPVVFSAHGLLMEDESPRLRYRLAARNVQQVTAVSQPAAEEYARLLGWRGTVKVIDNGVPRVERSDDLGKELRRSLNIPDEAFVFMAMGNIKPEKGFEDLLAAAAALRRQCTEHPFVVLIAGARAESEYDRMLTDRHRSLALDDVVQFLGFRSDTQAIYSAADAFVLPSRKEGLPMVLLEAMTCALPVVATEVGAVPDVVRHNTDGLLVHPASPEQFAEAMSRLLTDGGLRRRLGDAAARRVEEVYSVEAMARKYLAVFEQCVFKTGRPKRNRRIKADARPRVLQLGPLPPLMGGMATVADNLRHSRLAESCHLTAINNGKTTPEGRSLLVGIGAQLSLLARIVTVIFRQRTQIVHIHTCAMFSFWRDIIHAVVLRLLGARVVWHIHDGSFIPFLANQPPVRGAIVRFALRRGSAVIVLSNVSLEGVRPLAKKVRWRVVSNGVPLPALTTRSPSDRMRILFLGNLTRRKGAFDLVDAVAACRAQGVECEVRLAGGEVLPGQRDELLEYIRDQACDGLVTLLGSVTGPAKDEALASADALALPSYAEGLPMAILEGMAHALPVLATRIGAIPDVVTDGKQGFLFDAGDVESLTEGMACLATDPTLRVQMGKAARETVEDSYSIDVMAEQITDLYRDALGLKKRDDA